MCVAEYKVVKAIVIQIPSMDQLYATGSGNIYILAATAELAGAKGLETGVYHLKPFRCR